jgi:hypothetical protein
VAVKNMHLAGPFGLGFMSALKDFSGERATEVLPVLQDIFLEELQPTGPLKEAVGQFIATRRLSGHTITVHYLAGCQSASAAAREYVPSWFLESRVLSAMCRILGKLHEYI